MPSTPIIKAIKRYLNDDISDYAIMLSGEWGAGKSYFVKNEVISVLHDMKMREVYISMIGVDSDEQLKRKIFEKINPFYRDRKSNIAKEANYLEALAHKKVESTSLIPKNLLLIFDDLERINPDYFEAAMGLINIYIEHCNTKCLFVCNEDKLEKRILSFREIKEKYIRFTYNFRGDFKKIIENELKELKVDSTINAEEVIYIFKRGRSFNLRTLFLHYLFLRI